MMRSIMAQAVSNLLALGLYIAAGVLLWQRYQSGTEAPQGKVMLAVVTLAALVAHAFILYHSVWLPTGLNLSLTGAVSLVTAVVVLAYVLGTLSRPIESLGFVVLPIAALSVAAAWVWPGRSMLPAGSYLQSTHIVISILGYGLMCLAAVQSLILLLQERHLRQRQGLGLLAALPPMQTTEHLMFQMIGIGFLLLTATLVSGAFFSEAVFGKPFVFNHHTVLALIGWGVYGLLLLGRWRLGWRGRTAIHWTLGGFVLLMLAYFGSKFVLEILLGR